MKVKSISWAEHFQRHASSGLTVASYCERYRLSPGMFYYWKRKISIAENPQQLSFQEVEVVPDQGSVPVFEIRLGEAAIIRIEGYVSAVFLRELAGC